MADKSFSLKLEDKVQVYSNTDTLKKIGKEKVTVDEGRITDKEANQICDERLNYCRHLFDNNGLDTEGRRVKLEDALNTADAPMIFPKTIVTLAREAQEPLLIGTQLMRTIDWKPGLQVYLPGAVGAIGGVKRMAEMDEYPEVSLTMGGGTAFDTIGKFGLAVKFSEEMLRYSQFDIMAMHVQAIGRAFARAKEKNIFALISSQGEKFFDNADPSSSVKGITTGRSLDGSANGSVNADDLFDAYTHLVSKGYNPDTLLMHPLTWSMFMRDPIMRLMMLNSGGGTYFATYNGSFANTGPQGSQPASGIGFGKGSNVNPNFNEAGQYSQNLSSSPVIPSYFPFPLRIVVSPFVDHNPVRNLTEVYLFDSNELGVILMDEELTTQQWEDPARDIMKMKFRERYNLMVSNEGQAIVTMKNISIEPNEVVLPAQAQISVGAGAAVDVLDRRTAIVTA